MTHANKLVVPSEFAEMGVYQWGYNDTCQAKKYITKKNGDNGMTNYVRSYEVKRIV
jgi:hypothetical protein